MGAKVRVLLANFEGLKNFAEFEAEVIHGATRGAGGGKRRIKNDVSGVTMTCDENT